MRGRMSGSVQATASPENEMDRVFIGVVSAWLATGSATLAKAEDSQDSIAAGRQLALQVCSVCHVVAPNQEFAPGLEQRTPSFEDIANKPDMSAEFLRKFITTTHWDEKTIPMTMPNPMLTDEQITQVSSYILSLRKHP
jgi:mono/diheme cytochrome c family protein